MATKKLRLFSSGSVSFSFVSSCLFGKKMKSMKLNRYSLFLFFLLTGNFLFSQVEEQRKYNFSNADSIKRFIRSSGTIDGLSTHYHSEDVYYDLYLDTPDFSLAQNHMSMRFRKRKFESNMVTYEFQLKSEMENASGLRMEVEETELNIYKVKTGQGWVSLTKVLDVFFWQLEQDYVDPKSPDIVLATQQLQSWIQTNAPGPIVPFQKLSHLHLKGLDAERIKTLTPVLYGSSRRLRSHIYIDRDSSTEAYKSIPKNRPATLPYFFVATAGDPNWVLESSLDFATFYPVIESKISSVQLCEFEVENKYFVRETGTKVMDGFEKSLKERFGAVNGIDSKYLQSLKKFRGE
jgi:hypothetical protein